ncbi:mucin-5AC-like [Bradysia coprophila]|uniref:mucin-5AC-like n=1 Tax=Bradysia coprophila TaxID=38358 RepID=UPI00187DC089|nr:mucin-5AC-like [Bradysia coprophila]
MDCPSKITKMRLKRCESTPTADARSLSKISCKIGDHFENAYINTGSSISIASTDLYRKLVADKCTFTDGTGTLHLIDETIQNQEYRVTTTTVKVIGKCKTINLVTFPDHFAQRTILGMDFLTTKSSTKSKDDAVFRVPEQPAPKSVPIPSVEIDNENQPPVTLLDWILNSNNLLKKPLYNILADGTADDDDLFAICTFMKRMPRMVSPIRSLEDLSCCMEKQVNTEFKETSFDRAPDSAPHPLIKQSTTTKPPTPFLDKANDKAVSSPTNHDTTPLKTSIPSTVPLDKPKEKCYSTTSMSQTTMLKTSTPETASLEPTKVTGSPSSLSQNETIQSKTLAQSTKSLGKADEKVISSSSKNEIKTTKVPTPSLEKDMDRNLQMNQCYSQRYPSSSSKGQTSIPKTSTPPATPLERAKKTVINPSSNNQNSTPRMSTTTFEKEKEENVSSSMKDQSITPRTSLTSLEKEREKILSLLSKTQTTTPRTSKPTSTEKAKENTISSLSKNQSVTSRTSGPSTTSSNNHTLTSRLSTPSTTVSYKAKEKIMSSSSRNQTATYRPSTSSLDRTKERVRSSSSKNLATSSRTPSTLDRDKENVARSANKVNTYHQVPPPKF